MGGLSKSFFLGTSPLSKWLGVTATSLGLGFEITPRKSGVWVESSIRAKKKGWLTVKEGLERLIATLVAAAASAPSSLSSMLDLCCTLETSRGPSEIPARLGLENSSPRPEKNKVKYIHILILLIIIMTHQGVDHCQFNISSHSNHPNLKCLVLYINCSLTYPCLSGPLQVPE